MQSTTTLRTYHMRYSAHSVHYSDVIMGAMASQITSPTIVYSTVYSGQRKHQSSASLAFVRGIHRWTVNFPYKGPATRNMFPFDDVIMGDLPRRSAHKMPPSQIAHRSRTVIRSPYYTGCSPWDICRLCITSTYLSCPQHRCRLPWFWGADSASAKNILHFLFRGVFFLYVMPSWHGNTFRFADPLWGDTPVGSS